MKITSSINLIIIFAFSIFTHASSADTTNAQAIYDKLNKGNISIHHFGKVIKGPSDEKVLIYTVYDKQLKNITHHFSLFENNTLMYEYALNNESYGFSNYFGDYEWIVLEDGSIFVTLTWLIGVHSELFVLIDPRKKKVLYKIAASWPVNIERCKNGFVVGIPLDVSSDGKGVFKLSYWGGNNDTKTLQVSSLNDDLCKQIGH